MLGWHASALAADEAAEISTSSTERASRPAQSETPVVALTHSARGPSAPGYGASAFGSGTFALYGEVRDESQLGGGIRVWATPVDRVTLLAEALRRDNGALSLALQVCVWNDPSWALCALGRLESEGFAEIEGELELGLLGSYDEGPTHFDVNAIISRGFDEAETDGELALRVGRDVWGPLRAGAEGRLRYRLSGDLALPGGRQWDIVAGPQLSASIDRFFASLLTGPTTVGVVSGVGWEGLLTLGGTL